MNLKTKFDAIYDITIVYTQTDNNNQRQTQFVAPSMTVKKTKLEFKI